LLKGDGASIPGARIQDEEGCAWISPLGLQQQQLIHVKQDGPPLPLQL